MLNCGEKARQPLAVYKILYIICNVFFMVLDLRLIKIGSRETVNLFFIPTSHNKLL